MFHLLLFCSSIAITKNSPIFSGNAIAGATPTIPQWDLPVPYTLTMEVPIITEALKWFEKNTCIRFKKHLYNETGPFLFLNYLEKGECRSSLGLRSTSSQEVLLNCAFTSWIVIREMAHSLGLVYEHNRVDRNTYIQYDWRLNKDNKDYDKLSEDNPTFQYDTSSIMQLNPNYGRTYYDPQAYSVPMRPHQEKFFFSFGSARIQGNDIFGINEYYGCLKHCAGVTKPSCKNGGQQNPNDCSGCVCPPMFTGRLCGQKHPGIRPFNSVSCGETIIAKNTTQTHAFYMKTKTTSRDSECYFFIEKNDKNTNIALNIHYFHQSVSRDATNNFCDSGVQIYTDGYFTNNAMTICEPTYSSRTYPKEFVSNSIIIVRMYRSDAKDVGSVDTVIGFSYSQTP